MDATGSLLQSQLLGSEEISGGGGDAAKWDIAERETMESRREIEIPTFWSFFDRTLLIQIGSRRLIVPASIENVK